MSSIENRSGPVGSDRPKRLPLRQSLLLGLLFQERQNRARARLSGFGDGGAAVCREADRLGKGGNRRSHSEGDASICCRHHIQDPLHAAVCAWRTLYRLAGTALESFPDIARRAASNASPSDFSGSEGMVTTPPLSKTARGSSAKISPLLTIPLRQNFTRQPP